MKRTKLNTLIENTIDEKEYFTLFNTMLDRSGRNLNLMTESQKKIFIKATDKAYKAKTEGKLVDSNNKKINENVFPIIAAMLLFKFTMYFLLFLKQKFNEMGFGKDKKNPQIMAINVIKTMHSDKNIVKDISDLLQKNMNDSGDDLAKKVVSLPSIQKNIESIMNTSLDKEDETNKTTIKKEIENVIIDSFSKMYNNTTIRNNIMNKLKNDLK